MSTSTTDFTENDSHSQVTPPEPPPLNLAEYGNENGATAFLELQRRILQDIVLNRIPAVPG